MEVVRERRENWRMKIMEKSGSLGKKVLSGVMEEDGDPGRDEENF